MANAKRTKQETIDYFRHLAYEFERQANVNNDLKAEGKAEAYELCAFELEKNMQ